MWSGLPRSQRKRSRGWWRGSAGKDGDKGVGKEGMDSHVPAQATVGKVWESGSTSATIFRSLGPTQFSRVSQAVLPIRSSRSSEVAAFPRNPSWPSLALSPSDPMRNGIHSNRASRAQCPKALPILEPGICGERERWGCWEGKTRLVLGSTCWFWVPPSRRDGWRPHSPVPCPPSAQAWVLQLFLGQMSVSGTQPRTPGLAGKGGAPLPKGGSGVLRDGTQPPLPPLGPPVLPTPPQSPRISPVPVCPAPPSSPHSLATPDPPCSRSPLRALHPSRSPKSPPVFPGSSQCPLDLSVRTPPRSPRSPGSLRSPQDPPPGPSVPTSHRPPHPSGSPPITPGSPRELPPRLPHPTNIPLDTPPPISLPNFPQFSPNSSPHPGVPPDPPSPGLPSAPPRGTPGAVVPGSAAVDAGNSVTMATSGGGRRRAVHAGKRRSRWRGSAGDAGSASGSGGGGARVSARERRGGRARQPEPEPGPRTGKENRKQPRKGSGAVTGPPRPPGLRHGAHLLQ